MDGMVEVTICHLSIQIVFACIAAASAAPGYFDGYDHGYGGHGFASYAVAAPAPVVKYAAPAPVVSYAPAVHAVAPAPTIVKAAVPAATSYSTIHQVHTPVVKYAAPAPVVHYAPAPVVKYAAAPAPVVHYAPAPVVKYAAAPTYVHAAPAPVLKYGGYHGW